MHTPALAADGDSPRRSLILAGGGMRVAWQAGVLSALEEVGLRFEHADGTSGGTINLAMLLSGRPPGEMCERWRTLRVRDFVAPLPLREYLRAPRLPGFGGGRGIVDRVFPHLGVSVERIRSASGIEGTFNVCNHATKVNEAVGHRDVDIETLVAGISLPIIMPAVRRGGTPYTDSVWIKDANLMGAVKRGADELWLLWCIGNTPAYHDGPFLQYVHMIEQSANGVLFEELDRIRELNEGISAGRSPYGQERPVVVHVVKPRHPIPLDPDFFLNRIDAATLVAMGYDDAHRYIATMDGERGVLLDSSATRMEEPGLRASWRERYSGGLGRLELAVEVTDAARFASSSPREARLVGRLRRREAGDLLLRDGRVVLEDGMLSYRATLGSGGGEPALRARRSASAGTSLADRLRSLRQLHVELRQGGQEPETGALESEGATPVPFPIVTNAASTWQRLKSTGSLERMLLDELLGAHSPA